MRPTPNGSDTRAVPRGRRRHPSHDEGVDEPAKLIENESVEAEAEVPADETEPVDRIEPDDAAVPPAFEEG